MLFPRRFLFGFVILFLIACAGPLFLSQDLRPYYFPRDVAMQGLQAIHISDLRSTVQYLTADSLEGRETTYPGGRQAARYLVNQFQAIGLQPAGDTGYLQRIPLKRIQPAPQQEAMAYAAGDTTGFHYDTDYFCDSQWLTTDTTITAPVVFAGYGIDLTKFGYSEYDSLDVRDKWVLVIDGMPSQRGTLTSRQRAFEQRSGRNVKYWVAHNHGAAGILFAPDLSGKSRKARSQSPWETVKPEVTHPRILPEEAQPVYRIPVLYLTAQSANMILRSGDLTVRNAQRTIDSLDVPISRALPDTFQADLQVVTKHVFGQNIVGMIPGNDSTLEKEYVAITAHYDHLGIRADSVIYHGADDNASGTAGVVAIARGFMHNETRPRRSIIFALFDAEEAGLLGSHYFAGHQPVALDQFIADINLDMIGRNSPDSVNVVGSDMVSRDLDSITRVAAWYVPNMTLDYRYDSINDPLKIYYRSDHYSFASHGIPAFTLFSGFHPDYHQPSDTMDKLRWPKMEKVVEVAYLTAWGVSNRPTPLKKNGVLYQ